MKNAAFKTPEFVIPSNVKKVVDTFFEKEVWRKRVMIISGYLIQSFQIIKKNALEALGFDFESFVKFSLSM